MSKRQFQVSIFTLFLISLGIVGCEPAFEPLRENNKYHFSINGYLDATADTQWVRVMPVRDSLFFSPRAIDATVTLEETATGRSVTMNDSLFSYTQETYAYNFWTAMDLQPEKTYRITATDSDGQSSYADVILPKDYPGPLVDIIYFYPPITPEPPIPDKANIVVPGAERVADLQTIYSSQDGTSTVSIPHLQDSVNSNSGELTFVLDLRDDFHELQTFLPMPDFIGERNYLDSPVIKEYLYLAIAGQGYQVNSLENPHPAEVSNVENGIGYVAGIISKTVPLKSCFEEGRAILIPCPTVPLPGELDKY